MTRKDLNDAVINCIDEKEFFLENLQVKHVDDPCWGALIGTVMRSELSIDEAMIEHIANIAARAAVKEFLDGPLTTATDADARKDPA